MKKRVLSVLLIVVMIIGLTACGNSNNENNNQDQAKEQNQEQNQDQEQEQESTYENAKTIEQLKQFIKSDVDTVISNLKKESESIKSRINNYDSYYENINEVLKFYQNVWLEELQLTTNFKKYAAKYAELIINSKDDIKDKRDSINAIHDDIYDESILDDFINIIGDVYNYYFEMIDGSELELTSFNAWTDSGISIYSYWDDNEQPVKDLCSDLSDDLSNKDLIAAKKTLEEFIDDLES